MAAASFPVLMRAVRGVEARLPGEIIDHDNGICRVGLRGGEACFSVR